MPMFRNRPAVVEARQIDTLDYDGMCEIIAWCGGRPADIGDAVLSVDTLEGTVYASDGDWIIHVAGGFYPCSDSIFRETYELA